MTDRPLNPNDRKKLAWCYHRALEAGDFETITSVLMMAESDPSLEKLILEVNDNRLSALQGGIDTPTPNNPFEEERDMTFISIRQQKSYGIPWTAVAVLILTFFFSLLLLGGLDLQPAPLPLQQGQGLGNIPEDPIALFQLYIDEVWNKQNMEAIPLLLSENHVHHDVSMTEDIVGLEAFAEYVAFEHNVLPDVTFTVDSLVANGNEVVGRVTMTYEEFEKTVLVNAIADDGKLIETWFDVGILVEAYNIDLGTRFIGLMNNIENATLDEYQEFFGISILWHTNYGPDEHLVATAQSFSNSKRENSYCTVVEQENRIFAKQDLVVHYVTKTCTFENIWAFAPGVEPTGEVINQEGAYIFRIEDGKAVESWWYLDDPVFFVWETINLEMGNADEQTQAIYDLNSTAAQKRAIEELIHDFVDRYVDALWNAGELDTTIFDDYRPLFNEKERVERENLIELYTAIHSAFPNDHITITDTMIGKSRVAIHFLWKGTHTETFEYQNILLPPSNEEMSTSGVIVFDYGPGGIIKEIWYADFPFLAEFEQITEG